MKNWFSGTILNYLRNIVPYLVVFIASLWSPSDTDLGWHLRYGEYFFKNFTILQENIFSWQMPNYHWVNHSWATDVVTFIIYKSTGFIGLTIAGALVVTLIFYFFARAAKLSFWQQAITFPILLYLEEPLTVISFRSQLLSLLALSILYYLFSVFEDGKRKKLFLALPLFLLWSNFHGGFILGLGIFIVWVALFIFKQFWTSNKLRNKLNTSEIKLLITILFCCLLSTLINPFGIGVYQETIRHFGNPLAKYIIEWLPFDILTPLWWRLIFWGVLIFISLLIIIIRLQFIDKIHYIVPLLILYGLSLIARRYTWTMFLVSIPIIKEMLVLLKSIGEKKLTNITYIIFIASYFYIVFVINPTKNILYMNWQRYCYVYARCSPDSAEALKKYATDKKILTFYNWGGWLIWNYPEIKPSIDGRMPFWRDETGFNAFADYYFLEQDLADVDKTTYDIVYMPPTKPIFKQMMRLVNEGKWELDYSDDFASIFVRL